MVSANPDLEGLYRRAAAEPQSMTRAERNIIFGRPPPDEEDRLCVVRTGHTLAELVTKASSNPDALTFQEAKIVSDRKGVHFDAMKEEAQNLGLQEILARNELRRRRYMNPSALEALLDEAQRQLRNSVEGEEKTALRNASDRWCAIQDAEMNAMRRREEDLLRARRLKNGTGFIKRMLEHGLLGHGAECWGFVVFRTGCYDGEGGESAWRKFREHFDKVAQVSVLHWNSGPELWPTFRAIFVEDKKELDGASDEKLRARFRQMRDGGGEEHLLPKGIRTSCFLVADREVIESEAVKTPYVPRYNDMLEASVSIRPEDLVVYIRALNPNYETLAVVVDEKTEEGEEDERTREAGSSSKSHPIPPRSVKEAPGKQEDEMAGFKGEATVALPRVFDWLHYVCFSAEGGMGVPGIDQREGWRAIYVQTRAPESWIRNWASNTGSLQYADVPRPAL